MKFIKMHGLGNDYIYFDCTKGKNKIDNPSQVSIKLSDRHFGIGSDGIIMICDSDVADFKMRIFNSDGSEAEMCGNGIRCVGKYVYDFNLIDKDEVSVETLAGIKHLKLNIVNGVVDTVRVDMGEVILDKDKIPAKVDSNNHLKLNVLDRKFEVTALSMGNPHAVIEIDNVDHFDVSKYGSLIEVDSHFPKRTNVEFVEVINQGYVKMRVFERGAGETLACGTGSCATVVACYLNGKINNRARVQLLGGVLDIEYNRDNGHVYMTGNATIVFSGEVDL